MKKIVEMYKDEFYPYYSFIDHNYPSEPHEDTLAVTPLIYAKMVAGARAFAEWQMLMKKMYETARHEANERSNA